VLGPHSGSARALLVGVLGDAKASRPAPAGSPAQTPSEALCPPRRRSGARVSRFQLHAHSNTAGCEYEAIYGRYRHLVRAYAPPKSGLIQPPGSVMSSPVAFPAMDTADGVRCSECHREVDEFTAIAERWGYWSDGCGELLAFCPECAGREFGGRPTESVPPAHPRAESNGF